MSKIIGIDLGTTYSVVAVFSDREGRFVTIRNDFNSATTPSVVAHKDGQVIVGQQAKARMALDPDNTILEIKRHMGEPFRDEAHRPRLGRDGQPIPYTVPFAGKEHSPQMVSAYILAHLKAQAEAYLGEPVTGAVITVPAYFTGGPRRATEEAGALAGLKVECLLSEPTAAAIAFGVDSAEQNDEDARPKKLLVYDLGGGTFDVSIIEVSQKGIEVLGVDGDHYLGGVDFDRAIIDWLLKKIKEQHGVDLTDTGALDASTAKAFKKAFARIHEEAEKVKIALSVENRVTVQLAYLFPAQGDMVNVEYEISRNEFLTMIAAKLKSTLTIVDRAIQQAKLEKTQIDDVLLVGGSTKIPKIRDMLEKHFGKPPRKDINPDECVAIGAAMQALRFVKTEHLSPEAEAAVEQQLSEMRDVVDITGHSLGVRANHDDMSVLIPKNSKIPAVAEQIYRTAEDLQTAVTVLVYQGEDPVASRNTKLTEFEMTDLPPMPAGEVRIKIRFELDVNGVLKVRVTNLVTDKPVEFDTKYGGKTTARPDDLLKMKPSAGPKTTSGPTVPTSMIDTVEKARGLVAKLSGPARDQLDAALQAYLGAVAAGDPKADDKAEALMNALFDVM